jgi:hypothetical protein
MICPKILLYLAVDFYHYRMPLNPHTAADGPSVFFWMSTHPEVESDASNVSSHDSLYRESSFSLLDVSDISHAKESF